MKQIFLQGDGQVDVMEVPVPDRGHGMVLVQNAFSLISPGTEGSALTRRGGVRGLVEKAMKSRDRIDQVWRIARQQGFGVAANLVQQKLGDATPLGYSSAGRVLEVSGDLPYREGDLVACIGTGFANHAEYVTAPKNLMAHIPEGAGMDSAAFGALACIALQGIRRLDLTPGENIGVIGLGLIGQLTVRLLSALGYRAFGVDLSSYRVEKAAAIPGVSAWATDEANSMSRVTDLTGGRGLDGVILCAATQSSDPVNQAFEMCRKGGRVSIVGSVGMELLREKMYVKELELRMSCSYGPGRYDASYEIEGHDYPINHARWTEQRNLELFLSLLAQGRMNVDDLITSRFKTDQAAEAYALVKSAKSQSFGVLFDYGLGAAEGKPRTATVVRRSLASGSDKIRIGLIGVGAYAKNVHVPNLRALSEHFEIAGVASRSGGSAAVVGQKADVSIVTSDYRVLLDNNDLDAVLISTRHAGHARMILDALDAGKHVFVEKPMTTTVEDGEAVVAKAEASGLVVRVGFNRRFAPHMRALKAAMGTAGRRMFTARVNLGGMGNHWSSGAEEGGRFLGEGVHFIDLANWMFDAEPEQLLAAAAGEAEIANPNLGLTLAYPNGCVAQILYSTLGNAEMGKEYYEAFGSGRSAFSRDFSDIKIFGGRSPSNLLRGEKGQKECLREFALAVKGNASSTGGADARAGLAATRVALGAHDFIRAGLAVSGGPDGH